MGNVFNVDEIFGIAITIEKNGAKFYRRAARAAQRIADDPKAGQKSPEAKGAAAILMQLAEMEVEHEKRFTQMRDKIRKEHPDLQPEFSSPDTEADVSAYLGAAAEGKIFDLKENPEQLVTDNDTVEQIFRTAIGLEKDSIIFYVAIKDAVPASLGKNEITQIIAEEMGHVTLLSKRLSLRS